MKKRNLVIGVALLVVILAMCLVACGPSPKKLEKMVDKIKDTESYSVKLTSGVPVLGEVERKMKRDGNITWQSSFMYVPECYTEKVENGYYIYTNEDGIWYRTFEVADPPMGGVDVTKFSSDQFEKDDKELVLKEEYVDDYGVDSMRITLEKDSMLIKAKLVSGDGMSMKATMEVYDIGETSLSLPKDFIER